MTTKYRGLTDTSFPHFAEVIRDGVARARLDSGHVIEKAFIAKIRSDPERLALWTSVSDRVWRYDGTIPISVHIADDRVLVWLGETRGEATGLLESENPAAVSWAEPLYERYRSKSEPLDES